MSAAATTGVNFVRVFFYARNTISHERKKALVALAYATARDQQLAPKEILIRSDLHDTTTKKGKHVKDSSGWHGTFAFKNSDHISQEIHVSSHGYTQGKEDYVLMNATHSAPKRDDSLKSDRKVVWPDEDDLEAWEDSPIGYSHVA